MSTYQTALDQLKFLTGQDNLSDADGTRLLDFAIDSYSDIAMKGDGRWKFDAHTTTTHPIATANLVASQNDYELDTNFLQIDRVECLVEDTWTVLTPIDRRDDRATPLSELYEDDGTPEAYDYDGNSIFLYPAPDTAVTAGLKVFYTRPVSYITALSDTIGIPRIHTEYLALKGASRLSLKTNDQNRAQLVMEVEKMEEQIRQYFARRDEGTPKRLKPKQEGAFNRTFKRT